MRGPQVTLSRTHPNLVRKIFALEVPEIADGSVEIVGVAREAGHRSKIAVRSTVAGLNAKGACIGPMGQRVRNVVAELHGEKIDIIDWSDDPATLVGNALSPANVVEAEVVDAEARSVRVVVPDYQLSLAIGREGQNARLAARLTGWRIDIHSDAAATSTPRLPARRGRTATRPSARGRLRKWPSERRRFRTTFPSLAPTKSAPDTDVRRMPPKGAGQRFAPRRRGAGRHRARQRRPTLTSSSCRTRAGVRPVGEPGCIPIRSA